ncbi:hypothetical protein [Gaoshiqia sp. Z1-71]|uniref:hypothetical protein n=1 Tax=Gaoshiqia hydrogeniformans TaxID=3290090 RepID=UPI003BF92358
MDVMNFFQKILSGHKEPHLPEPVKTAFGQQFATPRNAEWARMKDQYEVVFYNDELEHIARYKGNGERVSLKINLPLDLIPDKIRQAALQHGELMNGIHIQNQENEQYELIVRDDQLIRYFLLVNETGEVLDKARL